MFAVLLDKTQTQQTQIKIYYNQSRHFFFPLDTSFFNTGVCVGAHQEADKCIFHLSIYRAGSSRSSSPPPPLYTLPLSHILASGPAHTHFHTATASFFSAILPWQSHNQTLQAHYFYMEVEKS